MNPLLFGLEFLSNPISNPGNVAGVCQLPSRTGSGEATALTMGGKGVEKGEGHPGAGPMASGIGTTPKKPLYSIITSFFLIGITDTMTDSKDVAAWLLIRYDPKGARRPPPRPWSRSRSLASVAPRSGEFSTISTLVKQALDKHLQEQGIDWREEEGGSRPFHLAGEPTLTFA